MPQDPSMTPKIISRRNQSNTPDKRYKEMKPKLLRRTVRDPSHATGSPETATDLFGGRPAKLCNLG